MIHQPQVFTCALNAEPVASEPSVERIQILWNPIQPLSKFREIHGFSEQDRTWGSVPVRRNRESGHAVGPVVQLGIYGYLRWRAKKSRVRVHASSAAASLYIDGASQLLNAWPAA